MCIRWWSKISTSSLYTLLSLLRIFEYQKKKSLLYFMCFQLPTILHLYIQPEKTMKHFVVLRFQKVNMCRDGLSLSLPFFFLYVILNTCVRMWCLSGWFVCLIDRERERLREREEFCGYKKISNTKKMKKDILFHYYTYIIGREVPMNMYVWGEKKKPNIPNRMLPSHVWSRIATIDVCICIYIYTSIL